VPGIAEAMRAAVTATDPTGSLARTASVQRGETLIVNLPAAEGPFEEALAWILDRAAEMLG
jgi:molybdopterin biosynthesis enzyme MoaB